MASPDLAPDHHSPERPIFSHYTGAQPVPATIAPQSSNREEGALGTYLRALRHHPLLIALVAAAVVVVTIAWLLVRSGEYSANAQVLVTPISSGDPAFTGLPLLSESVDPTRTMQTAATILDTPSARTAAAKAAGAGWDAARVGSAVKIEPQGDSNVVTITATADDDGSATTLANAYARAALDARNAALVRQVETRIAGLRTRLQATSTTDTTTRSSISGQLNELQAIRDGQDPNFSLLQTAAGPASAVGPPRSLIVVLALLGGIALGSAAALALEFVDRRIRDEDGVLSIYPLPILARVPRIPQPALDAPPGAAPPPVVEEAFRTLQVQLDANRKRGGGVFMFTSASRGDGKSTSAKNLATFLASSGHAVILLDLDLRKPDLATRLNVTSDLSSVFQSSANLEGALAAVPDVPNLRVLSTRSYGEVTPLLESLSRRMPHLITQARKLADYVIIDTAPLGHVSDALRFASLADEIILVSRPGNTTRNELIDTRDLLERMGYSPVGLVVVGGTPAPGGIHYGYGTERGLEPEPDPDAAELAVLYGEGTPTARRTRRGVGDRHT